MSEQAKIFTYHFIETYTGRNLGTMRVRADRVELRRQPQGAWTTIRDLDQILDGGVAGGLTFAFPDQRALKPSSGKNVKSEAMHGAAYGSLDGETLNLGAVNGLMDGFAEDNKLMVLTFRHYTYSFPSYPSSATTMCNNAEPGGTGVFQESSNPDEHGDKYVYFGTWILDRG